MEKIEVIEQPTSTLSMNPLKFALWLFMATVVMVFAALTSAYLVRQSDGNWLIFDMPNIFYVSSLVVILSSVAIQWALWSAKNNEMGQLKIAISLALFLGFGFLFTQWLSWKELVNVGVFFAGDKSNPSGSFVYVFSGLHAAHIVSGLIYIFLILIDVFKYKVHSQRLLRIEMCVTYWHFLGALWIYLFLFLVANNH
ncbi:MAG: cytochrome oxidase subunit III [Bacteroidetes bacterium]|nr:MAG: cytochrome oxidase subunit III [Bacteroidota bacterium]